MSLTFTKTSTLLCKIHCIKMCFICFMWCYRPFTFQFKVKMSDILFKLWMSLM